MEGNDCGTFDSTAATFVWKDCENLEKFSRLILVPRAHMLESVCMFLKRILQRERERPLWDGCMVRSNKRGSTRRRRRKNFLTGIEVGRSSCCLLGPRN